MNTRKVGWGLGVIALMVAPTILWGADSHHGNGSAKQQFTPAIRETTTFGTLGLVDGQSARLSAVRSEQGNGDGLCRVELNFFDTAGNPQGQGVTADLDPGHAVFLDLDSADLVRDGLRSQIYAVVHLTSDAIKDNPDKPSCGVAMSIELFDQADGRTRIYQGQITKTVVSNSTCCQCCKFDSAGRCTVKVCTIASGGEPLPLCPPPCPS